MTVYRVEFLDQHDNGCYTDIPQSKGIAEIYDGFWVDENFEYAKIGKERYWIPASRYIIVTKLEELT
jgi:hypothetical protein